MFMLAKGRHKTQKEVDDAETPLAILAMSPLTLRGPGWLDQPKDPTL